MKFMALSTHFQSAVSSDTNQPNFDLVSEDLQVF